jgi:ketosteroid isomerase-like protein
MITAVDPCSEPNTNDDQRTAETTKFVRDWFDRLADSGWTAEVFLDVLSDDLVWNATGSSPVSGTCHGKAEYVAKVYRPLDEHLITWPRPSVERIIADGNWTTVEFTSSGGLGKNGTVYDMSYCWVMRRAGHQIVEVIGYYDTAKVVELFG